jgi:hypothetical protein
VIFKFHFDASQRLKHLIKPLDALRRAAMCCDVHNFNLGLIRCITMSSVQVPDKPVL